MHWADKYAANLGGAQIINDSKTPSGRVHVGSLRGALIHDAVHRACRDRGVPSEYRFGVDDYDPLDETPPGLEDVYREWLGVPLCNVPAPPGSPHGDFAQHFISEFFEIFDELGIETTRYRMRDVYRSGEFNEAIDTILEKADAVRRAYASVSGAERPPDWIPFQPICESCGKIATTVTTDYSDGLVTYTCAPEERSNARGCRHQGRISPFDGNGKLPWKLEWTAKWFVHGVTVEGAGKDHSTRGGSRDVAEACVEAVFGISPPRNLPYEFFLLGGAKMSSSKGVGASAREVADILSPELLRFLMLRTRPNTPVDFAFTKEQLTRLCLDYDKAERETADGKSSDAARTYELSRTTDDHPTGHPIDMQLVLALSRMPHVDPVRELRERLEGFSEEDERKVRERVRIAERWAETYGDADDRAVVSQTLPEAVDELSPTQLAFLDRLGETLAGCKWQARELQAAVFDAARLTPLPHAEAFVALYTAFLGSRRGPRAGNFLEFLGHDFVTGRLRQCRPDTQAFWRESSESEAAFAEWLASHREEIKGAEGRVGLPPAGSPAGVAVLEVTLTLEDDRRHVRRVMLGELRGDDRQQEARALAEHAEAYCEELRRRSGVAIQLVPSND